MSRIALVIYFFRRIHDFYSDLFSFIGRYPFFCSQRAFNKHEAERMYGKLMAFCDSSISIMASKKINLNLETTLNKYNLTLSREANGLRYSYRYSPAVNSVYLIKTNVRYVSWIFQEFLNFHESLTISNVFFLWNDLF